MATKQSVHDSLEITSKSSRDKSPSKASDDPIIRELVKRRGIIKGRFTKFVNYLNSITVDNLKNHELIDLKLRIQGVQNLFIEFNTVQSKLEEYDANLDEQLTERELFENSYYSTLAQAEFLHNKNASSNSSQQCDNKHNAVKLPTITMPSFDGSYENWLEFRDTFTSLIHNSNEISNIQKFHYLKSSLKGGAELVIDSLEFTSDNYEVAWELLLNRYNNCRLLIHNHVKSLFNLQSLHKESPSLIRKLIDNVLKNLRALKILGEPTDSWDTLIIHLVVTKLDQATEREWEQQKSTLLSTCNDSKSTLKIGDLLKFLKDRADMLETLAASHNKHHTAKSTHTNTHHKPNIHCNVNTNSKPQVRDNQLKHNCPACNAKHPIYSCLKFIQSNLESKLKVVKSNKLCINCLRPGHTVDSCRLGPCRLCNMKHNTLIHSDTISESNQCESHSSSRTTDDRPVINLHPSLHHPAPARPGPGAGASIQVNNAHIDNHSQYTQSSCVLLSTALVEVADSNKQYHLARALLDSGSQRCFMTKSLSNLLNLPVQHTSTEIRGVGNSVTQTSEVCKVELKSRTSPHYYTQLQCFVLPNITSSLPAVSLRSAQIDIPDEIQLADPHFYESQTIDLLIGADRFWDLLKTKKLRLPSGPYLNETHLGWIISGPVNVNKRLRNNVYCNFSQSIDFQLRQFWELEEVPRSAVDSRSDEERACEIHFIQNTTRNDEGRFSVRIPFKYSPDKLGESFSMAERRFLTLEKRLQRNPSLKKLYCDFINEYLQLGHMIRVESYGNPHYFLVHHGVLKEQSSTTKLRAVFEANVPTSTGVSLNDLQMVGPPIQGDLLSILLRFRQHKYTACADVEKMYRQCLIDKDQRDLQLILWRDDPSEQIGIYQLQTVTYGTASAAYLSCRCLKQLAVDCEDPEVKRIINEDFYVDDMITGCDDKNLLLEYCAKTTDVLQSGCFPLRKWLFNFDCHDTDMRRSGGTSKPLTLGENVNAKTLGLGWYNISDEFYFNSLIHKTNAVQKITKRVIMSIISQIFDPLGLLSPVIVTAKVLLQRLWLLKLDWDDEVPSAVAQVWFEFTNALPLLETIRIPRHVIGGAPMYLELHIFTDASETAYGTCVYVRTININGTISCNLLCSKSKVAPLRPLSTPKLELLGFQLGTRVYEKVRESLRCKFRNVVFWCDSTIVLAWLRMAPNTLKTFVQNRVVEIQDLTKDASWRHVRSKDNPADLISRGISLSALSASTFWWHGPSFLQDSFDCNAAGSNDFPNIAAESLPEIKSKAVFSLVTDTQSSQSLFPFSRFSQFTRMRRACAYVLRFIHNARHRSSRRSGQLSLEELNYADTILIQFSQQESFPIEYNLIINNKQLKGNHNLAKFTLFADNNKILRVGGRIKYSPDFSYDKKHPILISAKHWFSVLLFRHEHKQLQHAGPLALLYNVRESYWPVGGRNLARQVVHNCVTCRRFKGKTLTPIMGNLPRERITPCFPFFRCGVDYAGPVHVLNRKGKGSRLVKAYVCLFICFTTRAVHLELVSDLSTDAYLLALKRFISRRGKPAEIFSDNGRNFVGLMNEFSKFLSKCSEDIIEYATNQNIKFTFIPAYSAHMGGYWEAGVRLCKHHLLRSMGNAHLTFEELSTILTQVEAVLNSRPMSPLSSDPEDYLPLTPAHFLVGRPLTAPVSADLIDVPTLRLNRYQRVEQIRQHFWMRWAKEYISELQTRSKWRENNDDLQPNTLVVIKDDNAPPLRWSLGRIVTTFPGRDGISRVADIRTASGVVRRAFSKICPLFETTTLEAGASKAGGMSEPQLKASNS